MSKSISFSYVCESRIVFRSCVNVTYFFGISPHNLSFEINASTAPSASSGSSRTQFGSLYRIFLQPLAHLREDMYHAEILLYVCIGRFPFSRHFRNDGTMNVWNLVNPSIQILSSSSRFVALENLSSTLSM